MSNKQTDSDSNVLDEMRNSILNAFSEENTAVFLREESTKSERPESAGTKAIKSLLSPDLRKSTDSSLQFVRRNFTGTTNELKEEIKTLLRDRHEGDLDALADVVVFIIIKDLHLREAMKIADVSLNVVQAAYALCSRLIAVDKIVLTDVGNFVGFSGTTSETSLNVRSMPYETTRSAAEFSSADPNNNKPALQTESNTENSLDSICQQLLDAFLTTNRADRQLKAAIDYVVGVGYKRAQNAKTQLISCLEMKLIDGLPLEDVLQEHTAVRDKIATFYSQRSQRVYDFLSDKLPKLLEKIEHSNDKSSQKPSSSASIADILNDEDARLIKTFLSELQAINHSSCKELAVRLTEKCAKAKVAACIDPMMPSTSSSSSSISSQNFPSLSSIEKWLFDKGILMKDILK